MGRKNYRPQRKSKRRQKKPQQQPKSLKRYSQEEFDSDDELFSSANRQRRTPAPQVHQQPIRRRKVKVRRGIAYPEDILLIAIESFGGIYYHVGSRRKVQVNEDDPERGTRASA